MGLASLRDLSYKAMPAVLVPRVPSLSRFLERGNDSLLGWEQERRQMRKEGGVAGKR
jgi:hypothetical protein